MEIINSTTFHEAYLLALKLARKETKEKTWKNNDSKLMYRDARVEFHLKKMDEIKAIKNI